MDDLDPQAVQPGAVERQLDDLHWLGIRFHEGPREGGSVGPYAQSQRFSLYSDVIDRLNKRGLLYPCWCSRKEVLAASLAPHENDESPIYAQTCKPKSPTPIHDLTKLPERRGRKPALRIDVSEAMRQLSSETIEFTDLVFGKQVIRPSTHFGDYVIRRVDGIAAYQLACAHDDWQMGCGLVLRGSDLLKSTGRQLLLYRLFNWRLPDFAHIGLVHNESGDRLAKRRRSISIHELRNQQISPEEVHDVLHAITFSNNTSMTLNDFALDERLRDTVRLPESLPWSTQFK